jgi:hypothetical protein
MNGIPSVHARLACIHTANHPGRGVESWIVALPASDMRIETSREFFIDGRSGRDEF